MNSNIQQLSGTWKLSSADGDISIPCPIPGDNYSALQDAGRIPDPYWRDNERQVQWVAGRDWVFSRTFDVPAEMLARKAVFLSFDSIDTVAEIFVNGALAGRADNQFRRWRYEVKSLLRAGDNTLEVRIASPRRAVAEAVAATKSKTTLSNSYYGSIRGINFIRKSQCSPGWDWGLSLPASGLYGDVSLFGADAAVLDSAWCEQSHRKGECRVEVAVRLVPVAGAAPGTPVEAVVAFDGVERTVRGEIPASGEPFELRAKFRVASPRLWWPNGYGDQPLYPMSVRFGSQRIERKVGLRSLKIDRTPDKDGERFVIVVNGVEVFAKGADWIPSDARPRHEDAARLRDLLASAAAANMNILRVWGGGHFESDFFYEECDRLGILLWHDMMFACSRYPTDKAFLDSVREECSHQVRRLRDHACIALWCGDNECIGAIDWDVPWGTSPKERDGRVVEYARLNDAIGEAVREADPSRIFWPSSPSAGPGNFAYNDGNSGRGDTHYWAVWHGGARFDAYYRHLPRFCSEFGFQSFSSPETARTFASEKDGDLNIFSPVFGMHQKNNAGNSIILGMFGNYYRMPCGFDETLYLSQVQQAEAIRTGVEFWRSLRPQCMGTIFWQLNDNWPVASWSSLEFGGRWKALHHAARRFYAPLATFAFRRGDDAPLEMHIVSDLQSAVKATVTLSLRRICDGREVRRLLFKESLLGAGARKIAIPADIAAPVPSRSLREIDRKPPAIDPAAHFIVISTEGRAADGRTFRHETTVALDFWKYCDLPASGISIRKVSPSKAEKGAFDIELAAKAPSFFAWLAVADDPAGRFSDNLFTVLPGEPKAITYRPGRPVTAAALRRALSLMDLQRSYAGERRG